MRKILLFLNFVVVALAMPKVITAAVTENWVINDFSSEIYIGENSRTEIVETIKVDFGSEKKHGIFRIIPTVYRTKYGENLNIRLKLLAITDEAGKSLKYEQTYGDGVITLKIGHPDIVLSGKQTYRISYRMDNAVTMPGERAELYWNVTGNRWPVQIRRVTATVTAPKNSVLNSICFVGPIGSESQDCINNHDSSRAYFEASDLTFGSGLTFATALDETLVKLPGSLTKYIWFAVDNWILLFPIITLLLMLRLFMTSGRDKQYRNVFNETEPMSVPLFNQLQTRLTYGPPKNISPGEVGVLVDEKVHMQDITATAIDLARRGFYTIKEIPKKGLFGSVDFELLWNKRDETTLFDYEIKVLDMLFDIVRKSKSKLSSLPEGASMRFDEAVQSLYTHMTEKGYFAASPKKIRSFYVGLGLVLMIASLFQAAILGRYFHPLLSGLAVFLSGLIVLGFSPFMPARTAKGRKKLEEIVGLKEWIKIGAWREQIHEKHNFLEQVLPYTIVFGLTQKFISAFDRADLKKLTWYTSEAGFNEANFSRSFSHFGENVLYSVSKSRSAQRASNWGGFSTTGSSSGGSGFSGGSSGGGFGGGGGGSW